MAEQEQKPADITPEKSTFDRVKDTTKELVSKLLSFFREDKTEEEITKKSPTDKILKGIVKALVEQEAQRKDDFVRDKKLAKNESRDDEKKHQEIIKVLLGIPQPEPQIIEPESEDTGKGKVKSPKKKTTTKKGKGPTAKKAKVKPTVKKTTTKTKSATKPKASPLPSSPTVSATTKIALGLTGGAVATGALAMPSNNVADVIKKASQETGVALPLLYAIAKQESGFDPNIKAGTSSATGLFQFIKGTWETMVKNYGSKYPILKQGPTNPEANALAGALFIKENSEVLTQAGIPVNATTIYAAHFLGPGGTKKLFSLPPDGIAANALPEAASANKNIFYKKGVTSQPRTVSELLNVLFEKVGQYEQKYAQVLQSTGTQVAKASVENKDMKVAAAEQPPTNKVVNNVDTAVSGDKEYKKTKKIDDRNPYERAQG